MLEDKIDLLIAALDRNTASRGGASPATGGKQTTVLKGAGVPPKPTFEAVKLAVVGVKEQFGLPAAKKIIKEAGGAAELAGIKSPKYGAVIAACDALMAGEDTTEDATADEDEDAL